MTSRLSAGFDALSIARALELTVHGSTAAELHVFAYLACLLAYYEGRSPDEWAYDFSSTPAGSPYADVLAQETDRLRAAGRIIVDAAGVLALSSAGRSELKELRQLRSCSLRERFLEAACSVATLLPLPTVVDALAHDPQLQMALRHRSSRALMQPVGLALVDEQFSAIRLTLSQEVPSASDLLIPTSVWLTYLSVEASFPSQGE